jgi:hypothetical protein
VEKSIEAYPMLPAADAKKTWWSLLGFANPPAKVEDAEAKWKERIRDAHPDAGGSANQAAEINAAMDEARRWYANREVER